MWRVMSDDDHGRSDRFYKLGKENTRDIIACGFDINKTFIFSNLEYVGTMYPTIVKIEKAITYSQVAVLSSHPSLEILYSKPRPGRI